jgi:serine/threonine protein kinase
MRQCELIGIAILGKTCGCGCSCDECRAAEDDRYLWAFRTKPTVYLSPIMQRHSFTALNSTFVVDSEYQFVKELGQGAYGCVVAARHRRSGEGCAIKKITNINTKVDAITQVSKFF